MNLEQVRQFARAVGTRVESASGEWAQVKCPFAPFLHDSGRDSHPSAAISYGNSIESVYNCFTCEAGDLFTMLERLRELGAKAPRYDLKAAMDMWVAEESADLVLNFNKGDYKEAVEKDQAWPESYLDGYPLAYKIPMAMDYLNDRSVSRQLAFTLDIRWDLRRRAVSFPVRNWGGALVGMRGRRLCPGDAPPYHMYGCDDKRNKLVWYGESTIDLDKTVVMVESVFDYASVFRVYQNILAPLSVGIGRDKAKRVRDSIEIVTLFDRGQGGDKGRDKISKYLPKLHVTHLLPPKRAGDPGEMTVKRLTKKLSKYMVLNPL